VDEILRRAEVERQRLFVGGEWASLDELALEQLNTLGARELFALAAADGAVRTRLTAASADLAGLVRAAVAAELRERAPGFDPVAAATPILHTFSSSDWGVVKRMSVEDLAWDCDDDLGILEGRIDALLAYGRYDDSDPSSGVISVFSCRDRVLLRMQWERLQAARLEPAA
jgi:hypothetical protein